MTAAGDPDQGGVGERRPHRLLLHKGLLLRDLRVLDLEVGRIGVDLSLAGHLGFEQRLVALVHRRRELGRRLQGEQLRDIGIGVELCENVARFHFLTRLDADAAHQAGDFVFMDLSDYDDRFPGGVLNPQHYYFLPDDGGKPGGGKNGTKPEGKGTSAVWKGEAYKYQHHMLSQIQAKLNEQLKCDPGGLANMSHGKCPLSTHLVTRIWHETCHTLTELAEGLDLDLNRQQMARKQCVDELKGVGFDKTASDNSHTVVSKLARVATRRVGKAGAVDTKDHAAFLAAAIEATTDLTRLKLADVGIAVPAGGWRAVEKLIECCCRWAVNDFNPAKLTKSGLNPGAAAHLMLPTDDTRTRQIKGQRVGAANRGEHSDDLIAEALDSIEADGAEPTISEIARRAGRSRDTVKRRVFAVYVARIATRMLADALKEPDFPEMETGAPRVANEYHVWGAPNLPAAYQPSPAMIQYAHRLSDLPDSWHPFASGIDWRDKQLRLARSARQKVNRLPVAGPPAGKNAVNFMASGPVKIFRSSRPAAGRAAPRDSNSGNRIAVHFKTHDVRPDGVSACRLTFAAPGFRVRP